VALLGAGFTIRLVVVDETRCVDKLNTLHGDAGFAVDQGGLAGTPGEIKQMFNGLFINKINGHA
jgi:hypothetical protein